MATDSISDAHNASTESTEAEETLQVSFRGQVISVTVDKGSTVLQVKERLEISTSIPPSYQKLVSKGRQLQDNISISSLSGSKLLLLGTPPTTITEINSHKPPIRTRSPYAIKLPSSKSASSTPDSTYTFHRLVPLLHLPNANLARDLLDRLVHDRGIIAIMKKYKWSVGALVEMDPAEHTYVDHKTLGLNRNKGEVIELRIRTDEYAGFRQYRSIRNVLCHELTHNVHGPHDSNFWSLCKKLEREVVLLDPFSESGAHALSHEEIYEGEHGDVDGGAWEGGTYTLGGQEANESLSRRDILADAAMRRMKKEKKEESSGSS
jgi:hypothetical protein